MTPVQCTIVTTPPSTRDRFQSGASDGAYSDPSAWLDEALRRLAKIEQLAPNWDGEGSPPTNRDLVSAAESLLWRVADDIPFELPVPFIAPIAGGGFQLEWSYQNKYLELEFTEPGIIGYLREQEHAPEDLVESNEYPIQDTYFTRGLLSWITAP